MQKTRAEKRIKNLKKIRAIVEIAKIDTINKLSLAQSTTSNYQEMANLSQEVISFAHNKLKWSNKLEDNFKKKNSRKVLWVYITIPSKLMKISHDYLSNMILNEYKYGRDQIIAIGDVAIKFCKNNKLDLVKSYDDLIDSDKGVSSLITSGISNNLYKDINIVAYTPKIKEKPWKIYPFKEVKISKDAKKKKYYYSLLDIMENVAYKYISTIINGVYQDAYQMYFKEKLAKHEKSLKTIDEKLRLLRLNQIKEKRKKETESFNYSLKTKG